MQEKKKIKKLVHNREGKRTIRFQALGPLGAAPATGSEGERGRAMAQQGRRLGPGSATLRIEKEAWEMPPGLEPACITWPWTAVLRAAQYAGKESWKGMGRCGAAVERKKRAD